MGRFKVKVGELLEPGVTSTSEGTYYHFDSVFSGHVLLLYLASPAKTEIELVESGDWEYALYIRNRVIFFLFANEVVGWSLAPFSWWSVPLEQQVLPGDNDPFTTSAWMSTILVDSDTGVVKAIRNTSFSPEFTATIHQAILDQATEELSEEDLTKAIDEIDSEFPETEMLLPSVLVRCKAGDFESSTDGMKLKLPERTKSVWRD
jgi:hypothetical protein